VKDLVTPRRLIERFLQSEGSGGFVLFACAALAFALANSPWAASYFAVRDMPIAVGAGDLSLAKPLVMWIDELLMVLFFLLVGLEIKREIVQGELKDPRASGFAIAAAIGGMVLPALIYVVLNPSGPQARGWGVPMATDIAFAVGVITLLGRRVPLGLKVFLTAFAIADDLGAVLVIAIFYTSDLHMGMLALAVVAFGVALVLGLGLKVRWLPAYFLLGLAMWFCILESGVHATIAGVALAICVPITRVAGTLRPRLDEVVRGDPELLEARLHTLELEVARGQSPLHRLEHRLAPWVVYLVLPVFAFFSAGVSLAGAGFGRIAGGVFWGLVIGKPIGVTLGALLAVRFGLARLPPGVRWGQIMGASILGGIGFTMSLFVAGLAFGDPRMLDQAKIGVLSASMLAAIAGYAVLVMQSRNAAVRVPAGRAVAERARRSS
jgi:NhaA family Na+:H+ antiporter